MTVDATVVKPTGAQYAPVGPIRFLRQLETLDALGDYHLIIAPDVLSQPREYRNLYMDIKEEGRRPYVILDNGVIEQGYALEPAALITAVEVVSADLVVLPDKIADREATIYKAKEFLQYVHDLNLSLPYVMRVPQGLTMDDIATCIRQLANELGTEQKLGNYWGVPRWMANEFGSRAPVVRMIREVAGPHAEIHLLGMSHHLADDLICTTLDQVVGIDSANPLVLGMRGLSMEGMADDYEHVSRGAYWHEHEYLTQAAVDNVRYVRRKILEAESVTRG